MSHLVPRRSVPDLVVPTLAGGTWSIATARPERFSLIVFYLGLHCPICATYVPELEKLAPDFASRGVEAIAISGDTEARARESQAKWGLKRKWCPKADNSRSRCRL